MNIFHQTQKCLSEYGSFALHNLNRLFQNITLSYEEKFKLFDCLVGSVLNYAAEVWGFHKGPDVERLHTRFCRSLLGVKKSTNLSALYSELGRKPLLVFRKIRLLKYWVKILNTDNILLKNVYYMLVDGVIAGNNYNGQNWAFQIKNMLNNLGFSHVWNNQEQNDIPFNEIKQRIIDQTNQEILMANTTSSKLKTYCLFKLDTSCESYLNTITLNKYKFALSRFRLSSHNLALETGRYYNIPKENKICTFCNMNKIESEYHFLLVCPLYAELRRQYLPQYYCRWPSITKFKNLMQSKSERVIKRLRKYIFFAQNKRNLSA